MVMKLQRSTLALVATALLLGGWVAFSQSRGGRSPAPGLPPGTTSTARPVFDFQEKDVVKLRVETPGQTVAFEQDEQGFWQMREPEEHPAEEAAIAFLLSRLVTDGLVSTTQADAAQQGEFGLAEPFATVTLTLQDGTEHSLVLGGADFSRKNYYALIDPPSFPLPSDAGKVDIAVLSENIFNGVDRPLAEWKAVVDEPTEAPASPDSPDSSDSQPEQE